MSITTLQIQPLYVQNCGIQVNPCLPPNLVLNLISEGVENIAVQQFREDKISNHIKKFSAWNCTLCFNYILHLTFGKHFIQKDWTMFTTDRQCKNKTSTSKRVPHSKIKYPQRSIHDPFRFPGIRKIHVRSAFTTQNLFQRRYCQSLTLISISLSHILKTATFPVQ